MIIYAVIIGGLGFLEQFMQFCKTYVTISEYFSGQSVTVRNSFICVTCKDWSVILSRSACSDEKNESHTVFEEVCVWNLSDSFTCACPQVSFWFIRTYQSMLVWLPWMLFMISIHLSFVWFRLFVCGGFFVLGFFCVFLYIYIFFNWILFLCTSDS